MRRPTVTFQKVLATAQLPQYHTDGAAGFDFCAAEDTKLFPGQVTRVRTGLRVRVPDNYMLKVVSRSGMAAQGVMVANGPGIIDSDYRGEISLLMYSLIPLVVSVGDRLAQGIVERVPKVNIEVGLVPLDTVRGEGGLGSTGK